MSVTSKWMFVLIGNSDTGKTTIQKAVIELLNGRAFKALPSNQAYDVTHPCFLRKCRRFFVAGRSYQELLGNGDNPYTSVAEYFERRIDPVALDPVAPPLDLSFISSHLDKTAIDLDKTAIAQIIQQAHRRFWNVCAIFLTNSLATDPQLNAAISELPWDERWVAENAPTDDSATQHHQLRQVAGAIIQLLIERTRGW